MQRPSPMLEPATPWTRAIAQRIGVLWPLKAVGTSAFMALFFWAYFTVLEHPLRTPIVMPTTFIDHWVPLLPWSYGIYVSLWVYVSLPPALMANFRALLNFGLWVSAMCLFCLAIFWWMPTQTPQFDIDWSQHPGLSLIKGVDAAGNACPSLHVASAVFSAFWLQRMFRNVGAPAWLSWLSALQCAAISWSTLATLQHVAWDVLAGAVVGAAFAAASLWTAERGAHPVQI